MNLIKRIIRRALRSRVDYSTLPRAVEIRDLAPRIIMPLWQSRSDQPRHLRYSADND